MTIDWSVMRGSVALFVVALLIAVGVVGGAVYFDASVDAAFAQQQRRLSSIRSRYQTVDEERALIATYLPRFRELESRGIVGDELRLSWIEALRAAARVQKIPALRYSIDKQTELDPAFELTTNDYRVYSSRMDLTLGLLHEEDLLRVIRELRRRAAGIYQVEECSLRRADDEITQAPMAENVQGTCVLRWLTLKKREQDA